MVKNGLFPVKTFTRVHAQGDHQTKSVYLRTTVKYLKPNWYLHKICCRVYI